MHTRVQQRQTLTQCSLANSMEKAQAGFEEWEPKTREEAQQKWEELQNTPDHLTLLSMYKSIGVEPIKTAKSVSLYIQR
jgi:small subunit ribosomal protein S10